MDNVSFMNKLDEVLKAVNKVNQRINEVESKLDGFNRRLDNVELKVNAELNLQKQENDAKINLSNQLAELQRFKEQREKEIILQDSFNKRLNILRHGLEEVPSQAWETRNQTKTVYDYFLSEACFFLSEACLFLFFRGA